MLEPALGWLAAPLRPVSLVWVCGAEEMLREQVLRRLRRELLDPGFADFNHQKLRLAQSKDQALVGDALAELPMMTDRRLLELHDLQDLSPKQAEKLVAQLATAHPGLVVVAVSDNSKGKSPLWEMLHARAQCISCDLDAKGKTDFVARSCREWKLKLTPKQQALVLERCAGSVRAAASALERLKLFAGEGDSVSDEELDQLVHDSAETQAWKLTDAIGKRKVDEAYALLERILQREPPQTLLSYLNSYLLGLVQVAELRPTLKSAGAIARELGRRTEFQIRKTLEELASWSEGELSNAFERLARADFRIKTGADPQLMMQLLVLQLCQRKGGSQ